MERVVAQLRGQILAFTITLIQSGSNGPGIYLWCAIRKTRKHSRALWAAYQWYFTPQTGTNQVLRQFDFGTRSAILMKSYDTTDPTCDEHGQQCANKNLSLPLGTPRRPETLLQTAWGCNLAKRPNADQLNRANAEVTTSSVRKPHPFCLWV